MKKAMNKRKTIVVAILAVVFTFLQVTGWQISMFYNTTVHQSEFFQKTGMLTSVQVVLWSIIELPVMFVILHFLFSLFERIGEKRIKCFVETDSQNDGSAKKKELLLKTALPIVLLLCWIPCFLAGYPGFYNYDVNAQVPQVLYEEVSYSAHHPLLHTLFVGNIITFGYQWREVLNDGIVLHSIIQMIICAIAFSYMIRYIYKISGKRSLGILAFCYYAFFPVIPLFAMSTTKDVLFSILLQICVIQIYEMFANSSVFFSSPKKIAIFILLAVLMCLFRKNGIYIVIAMLPFLAFYCNKKYLLIFGSVILLFFILDKGLVLALNAEEGSKAELLSVPMQQIARVYCEHGEEAFEQNELELLYSGISGDTLLEYNPFLADNIKNMFEYQAIENNKSEFFSLWLKKGFQYPKEYARAFLDNTYQAWYPGTSVYNEPDAETTYYFHMKMRAGGERDTKAPEILEFYNKIATEYYYQKLPVVRLLFSIGAMFWVALFTWSFAIYQKNKPLFLAMLPVLLCCATVLLGPISLVRYYLVLFYGFPVSVGFLCAGKKQM